MTRRHVATLKGSCNRCEGAPHCGCCLPVMLTMTQTQALTAPPGTIDEENRRFIVEDLTPMPFKEGLALRPDLAAAVASGRGLVANPGDGTDLTGRDLTVRPIFYRCRHYNVDERRCDNYDGRPPLCAGYPWYGRAPQPTATLPSACGYRVDVP